MSKKTFRICERPDMVGVPTMFYAELDDAYVPPDSVPIVMVTADFAHCETVHDFVRKLYAIADKMGEAAVAWDKAVAEERAKHTTH